MGAAADYEATRSLYFQVAHTYSLHLLLAFEALSPEFSGLDEEEADQFERILTFVYANHRPAPGSETNAQRDLKNFTLQELEGSSSIMRSPITNPFSGDRRRIAYKFADQGRVANL